ncbi:MAG: tRNA (N6-threonylcarbamoyladenosine(37)-N6)-methyltransferase TrmO [Halodesulfurarchaeum sp.]
MEVTPIGTITTPFGETADAPRQGERTDAVGTIHLETEYVPGLDGIEAGQDIIVVWFADEADRSLLQVDRRGDVGVFRTRSPARPNPICLTTCEIVAVGETTLVVRGVDMRDGSPVLDLKPPLDS